MKIIVSFASAGAGHTKAAEAVYKYLRQHYPGEDSRLVDVLGYTIGFFRASYKFGYPFLVKYSLPLWYLAFWCTAIPFLRFPFRLIARVFNSLNTRSFRRYLIRENPDYLVSTHFLSSEIAARLKARKKISTVVITVVTDFGVHPFWLCRGTDFYIAASEATRRILMSRKIKEESVRVFGIPIDEKFLHSGSRGELSVKLGISPDLFTVLIITGSFGIGPIEEIVSQICAESQVLVVCANNRSLYDKLLGNNYPNVRVFGFVDNVQELMAASDVIITKPGGLSSAELLAAGLFPIFISPIPGQEAENARILEEGGVGALARDAAAARRMVFYFKEHPDVLKELKKNTERLQKPLAVSSLCDAICQGSLRPAS